MFFLQIVVCVGTSRVGDAHHFSPKNNHLLDDSTILFEPFRQNDSRIFLYIFTSVGGRVPIESATMLFFWAEEVVWRTGCLFTRVIRVSLAF